jgi:hypothetical protein
LINIRFVKFLPLARATFCRRQYPDRPTAAAAQITAENRPLWRGRKFRTFNVQDDFNREALRIGIDTSLPAPASCAP